MLKWLNKTLVLFDLETKLSNLMLILNVLKIKNNYLGFLSRFWSKNYKFKKIEFSISYPRHPTCYFNHVSESKSIFS